ncbi:MAG TPA: nucleotide disphospho-sugar-binding domain-containing protein [Polyangiaceae bacterium]|nr:nucleotide disphospho-sugar-binding domain-containing protein [Polyangiaceae bacterium]
MARFLFAWELGDNYGHLTTFNSIAIELANRGHDVYVAAQNLTSAAAFFPHGTVKLLQSPLAMRDVTAASNGLFSYAQVIEGFGFQNVDQLCQVVSAWQALYWHTKPDVVILNAPATSLLAARTRDFALATIGTGYDCPPRTVPMPWFSSHKGDERVVAAQEHKVLGVINQTMQRLQLPELQALRDMLAVDREFLTTFKELDHFPQRKGGNYCGAQFSLTSGEEVAWPASGGRRIFVYVRPESQHFDPLLSVLRHVPARVIVSSPGISDRERQALVAPNIRIRSWSVRLERIRAECDLAISAGGHGTIAAFLHGGVPMVLLPNHHEQLMVARAAVATGSVIMPEPGQMVALPQMIQDGLNESRLRTFAKAFAEKYRDFHPLEQTVRIAEELEQMPIR